MPEFGIEVEIDGKPWHVSYNGEYDAAHAVAGALLAGADEIVVTRTGEGEGEGDDTDDEVRLGSEIRCGECDWAGFKADMMESPDGWHCYRCGERLLGRGDTLHG